MSSSRAGSASPSSRRSSPRSRLSAGTAGRSASAPEFSVLLPVYNERENLPLVIAMLDRVFSDK